MNNRARWLTALLTPASLITTPTAVVAQDAPPPPPSQVCMASAPNDTADGSIIVVVIPPNQEAMMAGRGFTDHACSDNPDDFTSYRSQICALASRPDLLQANFNNVYHVTPRELCDMANQVAGG